MTKIQSKEGYNTQKCGLSFLIILIYLEYYDESKVEKAAGSHSLDGLPGDRGSDLNVPQM